MSRLRVLFGTTNPGKLRELRRMVEGLDVDVIGPDGLPEPLPEVVEDGATFEANAGKKAAAWARWSGLHTLADDSGLCVDALDGAPGIHSARWSDLSPGAPAEAASGTSPGPRSTTPPGEAAGRAARDERNNDKLLLALDGIPDEGRGAEYRAVLALARPDGAIVASVVGRCRGRIGRVRRGTGGFGFDPLFLPAEAPRLGGGGADAPERTMAELGAEEKDAISHRGKAFRSLLPILADLARDP